MSSRQNPFPISQIHVPTKLVTIKTFIPHAKQEPQKHVYDKRKTKQGTTNCLIDIWYFIRFVFENCHQTLAIWQYQRNYSEMFSIFFTNDPETNIYLMYINMITIN